MYTIKYRFCDGIVSEVEVSASLFAINEELCRLERNNNKRNTRHHDLTSALAERWIEIADKSGDTLDKVISREHSEIVQSAIMALSEKQRVLLSKIAIGMSLREIAGELGVPYQALSGQMMTIRKKLQKVLLKTLPNALPSGYR